jgi:hypothetical protein
MKVKKGVKADFTGLPMNPFDPNNYEYKDGDSLITQEQIKTINKKIDKHLTNIAKLEAENEQLFEIIYKFILNLSALSGGIIKFNNKNFEEFKNWLKRALEEK